MFKITTKLTTLTNSNRKQCSIHKKSQYFDAQATEKSKTHTKQNSKLRLYSGQKKENSKQITTKTIKEKKKTIITNTELSLHSDAAQ